MKLKSLFFLSLFFINITFGQVRIANGYLQMVLDGQGRLSAFVDKRGGTDYLYPDTPAPFIALISDRQRIFPESLVYDSARNVLSFYFEAHRFQVEILSCSHDDYLSFEIIRAEPAELIDGLEWGPIPVTISEVVGEIIGVVRDGNVAIGLQVLNIKTLGGDYNPEGMTWSRGEAAVKRPWGSLLQAYSLNRDKFRYVDTWGGEYKNTPVAPLEGETVTGSKIALFLCPVELTLARIGDIELAEGLPHPTVDGKWVKEEFRRGRSYLIADFKESEIGEMIGYTLRAGLISLYHEGPFLNWGHYDLNPEYFPGGKAGITECARKAHEAGLFFGVHTLTNFITTNDPYVTPVPDHRLALTGFGFLMDDVAPADKQIRVSTGEYFDKQQNNWLHTVRIGDELIRYRTVSDNEPYFLLDCQRGAFGTVASSHIAGDTVGKLYDHAYEVFFPNLELQREIARNLALMFNETGIDHLDFDGHEGCLASGQGDYAINLFAQDFYENLDHEVLNGTSLSKTYYWHINTFNNWGEPWYGGFKESMQEYRIANQALFDRNFVPHMLGWYLLTANTTLEEMEWMLARAAGYDAGFAMVARPISVRANPVAGDLLDAIREWEAARLSGAFSQDQRNRLKDPGNEFHLEKTGVSEWNLYQYDIPGQFTYIFRERQPGEPAYDQHEFTLASFGQPFRFRLEVTGEAGSLKDVRITLDHYYEIFITQEILSGETVICDGKSLRLYDGKGKFVKNLDLPLPVPVINEGPHTIRLSGGVSGEFHPAAVLTLKALERPEKLAAGQ